MADIDRSAVAELARRAAEGDVQARESFAEAVASKGNTFRGPKAGRPGSDLDKAIAKWAALEG